MNSHFKSYEWVWYILEWILFKSFEAGWFVYIMKQSSLWIAVIAIQRKELHTDLEWSSSEKYKSSSYVPGSNSLLLQHEIGLIVNFPHY